MEQLEVKPCLQCRVCGSADTGEKGWTATSFVLPNSGRTVHEFFDEHLVCGGGALVEEVMLCSSCLDLVVESDDRFSLFLESLASICSKKPSTCECLSISVPFFCC